MAHLIERLLDRSVVDNSKVANLVNRANIFSTVIIAKHHIQFVIKCLYFSFCVVFLIKKKTECVVKTHDRSETFVLQGNIVIIHQSLLNSIFTTKLYILMKKINYKQR
jgi:hypothetical protein